MLSLFESCTRKVRVDICTDSNTVTYHVTRLGGGRVVGGGVGCGVGWGWGGGGYFSGQGDELCF